MNFSTQVVVRFNEIPALSSKIERGIVEATNRAVMTVIAVADPLTPVRTGDLKGRKDIGLATPGSYDAYVHWLMHYALYQDKGTIHIAPRLFATTGADRAGTQWVADMTAIGGKL